MENPYGKVLLWLPRILSIMFAVFLSLFAFDVFSEGYGFSETLLALFMHLIPAFILIVCIVIAWKKSLLGGALFFVLGIVSVFFFSTHKNPISFMLISFPVFFAGALFILSDYFMRYRIRSRK
ncbi:MAG: hypothetical protein ACLFPQ_02880 [Candidatus Woesearchaeota archaeon]